MTTGDRPLISVVCPVYNEGRNVESLLGRLNAVADREPAYDWEFIFVDDGSVDDTPDVVSRFADGDPRVKMLQLTRNFGHQMAITAGLRAAAGDAVASLDGDLQHPPELLSDFLRKWESGFEIVVGVRRSTGAGWMKRWTSRRFYWLINRFADVPILADGADFRLMSRRVLEAFLQMRERARFIRGLVNWMGFDIGIVRYDEDERAAGESKYSLTKMVYFASDAITSFSALPLRIATVAGAITSLGAAAYGLYILGVFVFRPETIVPGWTSLILVVVFVGGLQLLFLGIIGEYIHRIFDEVKNRPLYLVKKKIGFDS